MKKILILIFIILSFLTISTANSQQIFIDAPMYYLETSIITFAWDPPIGAVPTGYEIQLECIDNGKFYKRTSIAPHVTYKRPLVGHFILQVRSYITNSNGSNLYSEWVTSEDPDQAQVYIDGQLRRNGAWFLYWGRN